MKLTTKDLTHFLLKGAMASAVALAGGNALAADAKPNAVTAIDISLEPDATMIQHATATNDRLLKVFPKGFALAGTRSSGFEPVAANEATRDFPSAT
jgi:hypothetical protein